MKFGVVQVQFKLSEKANEIVSIFVIKKKLKNKAEAINFIIEQHGGVD